MVRSTITDIDIKDAYYSGFQAGYLKGLERLQSLDIDALSQTTITIPYPIWHNTDDGMPDLEGDYLVKMGNGNIMNCVYDEDYGQFGVWNEYFDPETMASLGRDWVELEDVEKWMDIPEGW